MINKSLFKRLFIPVLFFSIFSLTAANTFDFNANIQNQSGTPMSGVKLIAGFYADNALPNNTLLAEQTVYSNAGGQVSFNVNLAGNYYVEIRTLANGYVGKYLAYAITTNRTISTSIIMQDTNLAYSIKGSICDDLFNGLSSYNVSAMPTASMATVQTWLGASPKITDIGPFNTVITTSDVEGAYQLFVTGDTDWYVYCATANNGVSLNLIDPDVYIMYFFMMPDTILSIKEIDLNPGLNSFVFRSNVTDYASVTGLPVSPVTAVFNIKNLANDTLIKTLTTVADPLGNVSITNNLAGNYYVEINFSAPGYIRDFGSYAVTGDRLVTSMNMFFMSGPINMAQPTITASGQLMDLFNQTLGNYYITAVPQSNASTIQNWQTNKQNDMNPDQIITANTDINGNCTLNMSSGIWTIYASPVPNSLGIVVTQNAYIYGPVVGGFPTSTGTINMGTLLLLNNSFPPGATNALQFMVNIKDAGGIALSGAKAIFGFYQDTPTLGTLIGEKILTSDAAGNITLTANYGSNYYVDVRAAKQGYVGKYRSFAITQNRVINISMTMPATPYYSNFSGYVYDMLKYPLANYYIFAIPVNDNNNSNIWHALPNKTTDLAEGDFIMAQTSIYGLYSSSVSVNNWYLYTSPSANSGTITVISTNAYITPVFLAGYPFVDTYIDIQPGLNGFRYNTPLYTRYPGNGLLTYLPSAQVQADFYSISGNQQLQEIIVSVGVTGADLSTYLTGNYYVEIKQSFPTCVDKLGAFIVTSNRYPANSGAQYNYYLDPKSNTVTGQILNYINEPLANYYVYAVATYNAATHFDWQTSVNKQADLLFYDFATVTTDANGYFYLPITNLKDLAYPQPAWYIYYSVTQNSTPMVISADLNMNGNMNLPQSFVDTYPGLFQFNLAVQSYKENGATLNSLNAIATIYDVSGNFVNRIDLVSSTNGLLQLIVTSNTPFGVELKTFDTVTADQLLGKISFYTVTSSRVVRGSQTLIKGSLTISGNIMYNLLQGMPSQNVFAYLAFYAPDIRSWHVNQPADLNADFAYGLTDQNGLYNLLVPTGNWAIYFANNLTTMDESALTINPFVVVPPSTGNVNYLFLNSFVYNLKVADKTGMPIAGAQVYFEFFHAVGGVNQVFQKNSGITDINGYISNNVELFGTYFMEVRVQKDNYLSKYSAYGVTRSRTIVTTINMQDAAFIVTGNLSDDFDLPVTGVFVNAFGGNDYQNITNWKANINITGDSPVYDIGIATTNQNGDYTLYLNTNNWSVFYSALMNSGILTINNNLILPGATGLGKVNLDLHPTLNVFVQRGSVKDISGLPLTNAVIQANTYLETTGGNLFMGQQTVTTDTLGTFYLAQAQSSKFSIEIKALNNGYVGNIRGFSVAADRNLAQDIILKPVLATVNGRLISDFGIPLDNYLLTGYQVNNAGTIIDWHNLTNKLTDLGIYDVASCTTDINGIYNLGLITNNWTLFYSASVNAVLTTLNTPVIIPGITSLSDFIVDFHPLLNTFVYNAQIKDPSAVPLSGTTLLVDLYQGLSLLSEQQMIADASGVITFNVSQTGTYSLEIKYLEAGYAGKYSLIAVTRDRNVSQNIVLNPAAATVTGRIISDLGNSYPGYPVSAYNPADYSLITSWRNTPVNLNDLGIFDFSMQNTDVNGQFSLDLITGNWSIYYGTNTVSSLTTIAPLIVLPPGIKLPDYIIDTLPSLNIMNLNLYGFLENGTTMNALKVTLKTYSNSGNFISANDYFSNTNGLVQILASMNSSFGLEMLVSDLVTTDNVLIKEKFFTITRDRAVQTSITFNNTLYTISGSVKYHPLLALPSKNVFAYPTGLTDAINAWHAAPILDMDADLALAMTGTDGSYTLAVATNNWAVFFADNLLTMNQKAITINGSVPVPPSATNINYLFLDLNFNHVFAATANYTLISLPVGTITVNIDCFNWANNATGGQYIPVSVNTLLPGMAYWAIISSDITVDLTSTNYSVEQKAIRLTTDWNLISNPQVISIDWVNVLISWNNQTYTIASAVSANLIQGSLYSDYNGISEIVDKLIPWQGYWVLAYQPVDLLFPSLNTAAQATVTGGLAAITKELALNLAFNRDGLETDILNVVANDDNANLSDALLNPAPPVDTMRVYAVKNGNNLMTDQIIYNADKMEWEFYINTQTAGNINLKLAETSNTLHSPFNYTLIDVRNAKSLAVMGGSTSFYVYPGTNFFKIQAINANSTGTLQSLINWPNPFNPNVPGEKSHIDYVLTTGTGIEVTVKIYSITGRKIRTLHETNKSVAGSIIWDGLDESGIMMPNDVYFFLITLRDNTGNEVKSKGKIVLWKK
ncbi:MAG: hypothetical protein PHV30_08400 [Candidatus Margulisbacteria bacterium]|nr:hypothetical protein [Candidatus Margulisiibacteriota bacterium]